MNEWMNKIYNFSTNFWRVYIFFSTIHRRENVHNKNWWKSGKLYLFIYLFIYVSLFIYRYTKQWHKSKQVWRVYGNHE